MNRRLRTADVAQNGEANGRRGRTKIYRLDLSPFARREAGQQRQKRITAWKSGAAERVSKVLDGRIERNPAAMCH